jgi:3-oxoacyl-[acyl-carrier protein] reductase
MPRRAAAVDFRRPVVWVTGASRGIGRELAKQFAMVGCEVCLSGRSAADLAAGVREIIGRGGRAHAVLCDVSRPGSVSAAARRIVRKIGSVDVLINNAGTTVFKPFSRTTLREFDAILNTNLFGSVHCIKAVLGPMMKRKEGWIINILSNAAVKTFEDSSAYSATKAGMLALGRVLREELRSFNIKVVNVIPGPVETAMWSAQDRRRYGRRMMRAKSVAEAVLAVYRMPPDVVVDELRLRPMKGDID